MKREEMLERIRTALGRPRAGDPSALAQPATEALPPTRFDSNIEAATPTELVAKFELEIQKLSGSAHRVASAQELEAVLHQILTDTQVRRVALSANPILSKLRLADKLSAGGITIAQWSAGKTSDNAFAQEGGKEAQAFREAAFEADAGITGVEFVLAETGSLILTSRTEGAQLTSLAPPVHVALYRENQVLASLDEVLERLSESGGPSAADSGRSVVFVTGTSRTADIEQVLIRGVHGPREVHAILVSDACLE